MARAQLQTVMRHLRAMLVSKSTEQFTDADLVRRYVDTQDELSFTALVRRYGGLVFNVCRRVLGDDAEAEDAFQATFFILARRAATIRKQDALACWFHRVAHRCANDLRRSAMRRKQREKAAQDRRLPASPASEASLNELQRLLDAEIERLPEKYRAPFLLCCLEGKSRVEAAQALGWKEGTLSGRLAQAREILQKRLTARGVTLSAALGAVALSPAGLAAALPSAVAHRAIDGALAFAAGNAAGVASLQAVAIANGVMKSMLVGKLKLAALLTLAASLTVYAASGLGSRQNETDDPANQRVQPNLTNRAAKDDAAPADENESGVPLRVAHQGKPIAGAKVWAFKRDNISLKTTIAGDARQTDSAGLVRIPAIVFAHDNKEVDSFFVRDAMGRVGGFTIDYIGLYPTTIAVEMLPTTDLSGRIRDADGKPLAGVEVSALCFGTPLRGRNVVPRDEKLLINVPSVDARTQKKLTDAEGKFVLSGVPAGLMAKLRIKAEGYGDIQLVVATDEPANLTLEKSGAVRLHLQGAEAKDAHGLRWSLQTNYDDEKYYSAYNATVAGVEPTQGKAHAYFSMSGVLTADSSFVVNNLRPGKYTLNISGGGTVAVLAKPASKPKGHVIVVESGKATDATIEVIKLAKITGRVVDADTGKPVANVSVQASPKERDGQESFPSDTVETDADGNYVYYAPARFDVNVDLSSRRFRFHYFSSAYERVGDPLAHVKLAESGHAFADIKVRKKLGQTALVVTVTDTEGRPVAATAFLPNDFRLQRPGAIAAGKNGVIDIPALDADDPLALRVRRHDAVNIPSAVPPSAAPKIQVAKENACAIDGRVTDAKGRPIPNAKVTVHWNVPRLSKNARRVTDLSFEKLTTDVQGRFQSSALWPTDSYSVSVEAPGFGKLDSKWFKGVAGKTETLDLQPVAILAVKGRVTDTAGKPLADVQVFNRGDGEMPLATTTDASGQFTLDGYLDQPGAFVSARAPGYRLVAAPAEPNGAPVTLTLRKLTEPPLPAPDFTKHKAALDDLARQLFELIWKNRATMSGFANRSFDEFARFDRVAVVKIAEQTKATGNATFAKRLNRIEQDEKLLDIAKADPDEALALLADRKGRDGYWDTIGLANQLRTIDAKKALRICEEAVLRARALDMPDRVTYLAEAGYVVSRCGNREGGKAIVVEAVNLAEALGNDERSESARGTAASYLAPFDQARALKLIAALKESSEPPRHFANAIDHVAAFDVAAAQKLLEQFPKGGRTFSEEYARFWVAYRLARTDLDAAVRLIAGAKERHFRTLAYVKLAQWEAAKNRPRAWKVLDTALADYSGELEYENVGHTWTNAGGHPALFALVAAVGRDIDYPDVSGAIARALSDRPTGPYVSSAHERAGQRVRIALALAFVDPEAARRVLSSVRGREDFTNGLWTSERDWMFARAFVHPEKAPPMLADLMRDFRSKNTGLVELFSALTAEDRWANTAIWTRLPQFDHDWKD